MAEDKLVADIAAAVTAGKSHLTQHTPTEMTTDMMKLQGKMMTVERVVLRSGSRRGRQRMLIEGAAGEPGTPGRASLGASPSCRPSAS